MLSRRFLEPLDFRFSIQFFLRNALNMSRNYSRFPNCFNSGILKKFMRNIFVNGLHISMGSISQKKGSSTVLPDKTFGVCNDWLPYIVNNQK